MTSLLISIDQEPASDAWGFVGTVRVGDVEAYRTLESFPTPSDALAAAQQLVAEMLGEILAGREWRRMRDVTGHPPTRRDYTFSALRIDEDRLNAIQAHDPADD